MRLAPELDPLGPCSATCTHAVVAELQQPGETREQWLARLRRIIADSEARCQNGHPHEGNRKVRKDGQRICVACVREWNHRRREKRRAVA
jgi:hypothetical protein